MTLPKSAIEKAVAVGYCFHSDSLFFDEKSRFWYVSDGDGAYDVASYHEIALDPAFWSALGKSLGLRIGEEYGRFKDAEWHNLAHRFFDTVLTNGDLSAFWEGLGLN